MNRIHCSETRLMSINISYRQFLEAAGNFSLASSRSTENRMGEIQETLISAYASHDTSKDCFEESRKCSTISVKALKVTQVS